MSFCIDFTKVCVKYGPENSYKPKNHSYFVLPFINNKIVVVLFLSVHVIRVTKNSILYVFSKLNPSKNYTFFYRNEDLIKTLYFCLMYFYFLYYLFVFLYIYLYYYIHKKLPFDTSRCHQVSQKLCILTVTKVTLSTCKYLCNSLRFVYFSI